MKRVTLNIDLEDNELFEQEVTKAVRDYAKQIAREAVEATVSEEIKRLVEGSSSGEYALRRKIDDEIVKQINSCWTSLTINNEAFSIIKTKVLEAVSEAVQRFNIKKIFDDKLFASIREYFTGGNDGTAV